MGSVVPFGLFAAVAAVMLAIGSLGVAHAESPASGGFLESATSTGVRPKGAAPLPDRGRFIFPAPYNTTGVRLTNAADCGDAGKDCVNDVGYAYWRNSNNHVGANTMLIAVTLDRARGGSGPTLFGYDKTPDAVTVLGPLFDATSPLSWATGEGWYLSATKPNALYVTPSSPRGTSTSPGATSSGRAMAGASASTRSSSRCPPSSSSPLAGRCPPMRRRPP
jgi:hypothetical protein